MRDHNLYFGMSIAMELLAIGYLVRGVMIYPNAFWIGFVALGLVVGVRWLVVLRSLLRRKV